MLWQKSKGGKYRLLDFWFVLTNSFRTRTNCHPSINIYASTPLCLIHNQCEKCIRLWYIFHSSLYSSVTRHRPPDIQTNDQPSLSCFLSTLQSLEATCHSVCPDCPARVLHLTNQYSFSQHMKFSNDPGSRCVLCVTKWWPVALCPIILLDTDWWWN